MQPNNSKKDKLLLHFCCGPCGPVMYEELSKKYEVAAFWYNPNIYPEDEYERRLEAFKLFCGKAGASIIYGKGISVGEFDSKAKEFALSGQDRCGFCYEERIENIVKNAKEHGFDYFATTLVASFYQKLNLIDEICRKYAADYGLNYITGGYSEFYYESKNKAKAMGLYLQKYCGCRLSSLERRQEKNVKR